MIFAKHAGNRVKLASGLHLATLLARPTQAGASAGREKRVGDMLKLVRATVRVGYNQYEVELNFVGQLIDADKRVGSSDHVGHSLTVDGEQGVDQARRARLDLDENYTATFGRYDVDLEIIESPVGLYDSVPLGDEMLDSDLFSQFAESVMLCHKR